MPPSGAALFIAGFLESSQISILDSNSLLNPTGRRRRLTDHSETIQNCYETSIQAGVLLDDAFKLLNDGDTEAAYHKLKDFMVDVCMASRS